jgi:3-hydroxypropanoate dehydrogenase
MNCALNSSVPAEVSNCLSAQALDLLFRKARTHRAWLSRPVTDADLHAIYALVRFGPTAFNGMPARFVFIRDLAAKRRLVACVDPGNVERTLRAPVAVVIAFDEFFYEQLPKLTPHMDARAKVLEKPGEILPTAFRNGTLQGAYFILAARALGFDCGPMSGFNHERVDQEFFAGTSYRSNFLCNLGYGSGDGLAPRQPRLSFQECCTIF